MPSSALLRGRYALERAGATPMEVLFALTTAFGFGFNFFFVRKGLLTDPYPLAAAFITLTVNFFFFLILCYFFVPLELLQWRLVYPFVVAGILAPGCARIFAYKGMEHLGMSISAPIINSETLFSVSMAIIFLNESINIVILSGIGSIITGLVLLNYGMGKQNSKRTVGRVNFLYVFYPITAAFFYGVSVFLRKFGLIATGSPVLGATMTSGTSWIILVLLMMTGGQTKNVKRMGKSGLRYFIMGGLMTCIAWLSLFYALNIGRVALVSPIANSFSLVTMILSHMFLRDVERITAKIAIATVLVVVGICLLVLGR